MKASSLQRWKNRVAELERTIRDVEDRKKTQPNREHPSDHFMQVWKFELRAARAEVARRSQR